MFSQHMPRRPVRKTATVLTLTLRFRRRQIAGFREHISTAQRGVIGYNVTRRELFRYRLVWSRHHVRLAEIEGREPVDELTLMLTDDELLCGSLAQDVRPELFNEVVTALRGLVAECLHHDEGEFEVGEWLALDRARVALDRADKAKARPPHD
jgi:hypothetical protein